MDIKRIFVVSSFEGKKQAECFIKHCRDTRTIEYRPWWTEFRPSEIIIDELHRIKDNYDGALVILTPDIPATIVRKGERKEHMLPNLNVVFEWGFFLSKLGKARLAVVKYGDVFIPSDLSGWILIHGSDRFNGRAKVPTTRTRAEFERWLNGLVEVKTKSRSGRPTSTKPIAKYDNAKALPARILQEPEGTIAVWVHVDNSTILRAGVQSWRYALAHATDGKRAAYGNYPNTWAICSVYKGNPATGPIWRFYCNGESDGKTKISINRSIGDGWHLFTLAWSRRKNVIEFSVDGAHTESRSFENWPLNYASEIQVGNWIEGKGHAYPGKVGTVMHLRKLLSATAVKNFMKSNPHP